VSPAETNLGDGPRFPGSSQRDASAIAPNEDLLCDYGAQVAPRIGQNKCL